MVCVWRPRSGLDIQGAGTPAPIASVTSHSTGSPVALRPSPVPSSPSRPVSPPLPPCLFCVLVFEHCKQHALTLTQALTTEPHVRTSRQGPLAAGLALHTCMQLVNMTHTDMSLEKARSSSGLVSMQSFRQLSRKPVWCASTSSMFRAWQRGPCSDQAPRPGPWAWHTSVQFSFLSDPVVFWGKASKFH